MQSGINHENHELLSRFNDFEPKTINRNLGMCGPDEVTKPGRSGNNCFLNDVMPYRVKYQPDGSFYTQFLDEVPAMRFRSRLTDKELIGNFSS